MKFLLQNYVENENGICMGNHSGYKAVPKKNFYF